jgi:hypothetical protein
VVIQFVTFKSGLTEAEVRCHRGEGARLFYGASLDGPRAFGGALGKFTHPRIFAPSGN